MSVDNESIAATTYESKISALKSQVRELEAEVHRARTDSRYWDEFNTISKHDAIRNENDKLRARHAALVEKYNELLDV